MGPAGKSASSAPHLRSKRKTLPSRQIDARCPRLYTRSLPSMTGSTSFWGMTPGRSGLRLQPRTQAAELWSFSMIQHSLDHGEPVFHSPYFAISAKHMPTAMKLYQATIMAAGQPTARAIATIARATAMRCRSPPLNWRGRCRARSFSPTFSSQSAAMSNASRLPLRRSGSPQRFIDIDIAVQCRALHGQAALWPCIFLSCKSAHVIYPV
jgi:hypothetical protein